MATAALNKFAKYYDAQILRRSGANCRLGDLYDWAGIFNQRLTPVNDNVVNWVVADAPTRDVLRQQAAAAPTYAANFADIVDLTNTLSVGVKPDLPNVPVAIAADLTTKTILNFHFEGVLTKPMPDEMGIQIRHFLEEYKAANFPDYQHHLRPYDLVVALYYAQQVVLKVDRNTQISAEAKTKVEAIGGSVTVTAEGHEELRFDQSICPFAVTLKATKSY